MGKAPLLVVTDRRSPNRFASYISEILDIEGLYCREELDLAAQGMSPDALDGHEISPKGKKWLASS